MRRRFGRDRRDDDMGLNSLARRGGLSGMNGYRGRSVRPSRAAMAWFAPGRNVGGGAARAESQPFHGFPGGRAAWESWRETGQDPAGVSFTPPQRDYYYRRGPTPTARQPVINPDNFRGV